MPVSPNEGPTVMEGLSHDGETGENQEREHKKWCEEQITEEDREGMKGEELEEEKDEEKMRRKNAKKEEFQ